MGPDHRSRPLLVAAAASLILLLAVLALVAPAQGATALPDQRLTHAQNQLQWCQDIRALATTSADRTWANTCIRLAQRDVDALMPPSPTPSQTPSASPTVTATPTSPPPGTPPPPSPSPSATLSAGWPTATNRGVPFGTALTVDTRCYLSTNGELIIAKHFTCPVQLAVTATNVSIANSQVDGGINNWIDAGGHSFTITDSTIGTGQGCSSEFGLGATDFSATRVKVWGFSDGVRLSGRTSAPLTVSDSYVLTCRLAGAHGDGVQGDGNLAPVNLYHNTIDLRPVCPDPSLHNCDWTAAVFFPTDGPLTVADNILAGGGYLLQIGGTGPDVFTGNRMVDQSWEYGPTAVPCGIVTTWSGNVAVNLGADGQPGPALRTVGCA